ncbi:MAG: hypothetical protein LBR50_07455, partial [Tannerella sp.]|jgi:hypothetical protein|nr:hypothetical protein [Tannerella sp.]
MGMIDFFMKYKDNEIIKPYYESLIAARRDMISSDSKMSFFEVRAPKLCTAKEYAEVLKEVLRCANPSIKYCDTERLMEIAEEEIPGIMDLLVNYPLRLIDPANQEEEGFYEFEPYRHAMWVRYTPPLNVGPVIDRYHEVLDMTLPNSSGLNIRLFTDPYAVIPVLFHEYCHYMEDPNEASVFLRTYAFSLKFYKKYRDANPEKDFAYVKLHEILGKSINPDNYNELNKLILQYYGEPESQAEAIKSANADLNNKNFYIHLNNQQQKWCPEIKMPLLNEDGDKTNADLIKRIRLRYAQVPRTITKDEFNIKKGTYQPVTQEVHQMYYKDQINFFDQSISNIKYSSKWRSFKNFCIDKGYITRYKGNDDYDTNSQSPSISADAMKDLIKKLEASGIDIDTAMKYLRGNKKLWI